MAMFQQLPLRSVVKGKSRRRAMRGCERIRAVIRGKFTLLTGAGLERHPHALWVTTRISDSPVER